MIIQLLLLYQPDALDMYRFIKQTQEKYPNAFAADCQITLYTPEYHKEPNCAWLQAYNMELNSFITKMEKKNADGVPLHQQMRKERIERREENFKARGMEFRVADIARDVQPPPESQAPKVPPPTSPKPSQEKMKEIRARVAERRNPTNAPSSVAPGNMTVVADPNHNPLVGNNNKKLAALKAVFEELASESSRTSSTTKKQSANRSSSTKQR